MDLEVEALKRVARCAKGAVAATSMQADRFNDFAIDVKVVRARVEGNALPPSWEVERHDFLRRRLDPLGD